MLFLLLESKATFFEEDTPVKRNPCTLHTPAQAASSYSVQRISQGKIGWK